MNVAHNVRTSEPTFRPDFAPHDPDGVQLSTRAEHAATIVTASGEIDASNIDRVTDYICHALKRDRPLVIDLSALSFFGAQGIPALFSVSEECGKAGVDWAVVVSHPVRRLLRIGDKDHRLPTAGSVPDALKRVLTPNPARRLLQLVTKSG